MGEIDYWSITKKIASRIRSLFSLISASLSFLVCTIQLSRWGYFELVDFLALFLLTVAVLLGLVTIIFVVVYLSSRLKPLLNFIHNIRHYVDFLEISTNKKRPQKTKKVIEQFTVNKFDIIEQKILLRLADWASESLPDSHSWTERNTSTVLAHEIKEDKQKTLEAISSLYKRGMVDYQGHTINHNSKISLISEFSRKNIDLFLELNKKRKEILP